MFDARFRAGLDRLTSPVGDALARLGVRADLLTAFGLVAASVSAVVIGSGHLIFGALLLIAAAVPDLLDGPVARSVGSVSRRGEFFDSVADRVSDGLLLSGTAWFLAQRYGPLEALLPMAVLALSMLISYERAKAESLGFNAKGGLMERGERIVSLAIGLFLGVGLLVPILWAMLVLTAVTAVQRFVLVWRQEALSTSDGLDDASEVSAPSAIEFEPRAPGPALDRSAPSSIVGSIRTAQGNTSWNWTPRRYGSASDDRRTRRMLRRRPRWQHLDRDETVWAGRFTAKDGSSRIRMPKAPRELKDRMARRSGWPGNSAGD